MQEVSRESTLIIGSNVPNVFMTYKRKRLFSRSDLHSDTHPEISVSKSSANFNKVENRSSEHILQNNERNIMMHHEYSQRNVEENTPQCENCDSQHRGQCSQEHSPKLQRLYSTCLEQQDFLISECNRLEQERQSQNSDGKQDAFHPINIEEKSSNAQSNTHVKSGSEQNCEEDVWISPSPDACSIKESDTLCSKASDAINCSSQMDSGITGTFTYPEMGKLNKDQPGSLCNDLDTNGRLSGNLITYHRKSKRKRKDVSECPGTTCASETRLAGSTHMALKDKKKSQQDVDNSHASPVLAPEMEIAVRMDTPLHFPQGTAQSTPSSASRDIDCNLPPVPGLDENLLPSENPPDFPGSSSRRVENAQTVQTQSRDKGKSVVESLPSTDISYENKYLQLFPEKSSGGTSQSANGRENTKLNVQASYNSQGPWLAGVQQHPKEAVQEFLTPAFHRAQSSARQRMVLDNILNRARGTMGNRTILPETFRPQTLWSEAELDCLWIGVRRHGRGNWEMMLRDRRLQFSPWRTPRELADKWQEEQARVFHTTTPVSQVRYTNPYPNPNPFPSAHVCSLMPQASGNWNAPVDEVQLSLGNPYGGVPNLPNAHFYNLMNIQKTPGRNSCASSSCSYFNPSDFHAVHLPDESSPGTVPLPHWLKEAIETRLGANVSLIHPGLQWTNQPDGNPQQPLPDNRYASTERRNEPRTKPALVVSRARNVVPEEPNASQPDGLIVIPSDCSSEETISDDHRP